MQHKMSKNANLDTLKDELSQLANPHAVKGGTCDTIEADDKNKERGGTPPKGPAGNMPTY